MGGVPMGAGDGGLGDRRLGPGARRPVAVRRRRQPVPRLRRDQPVRHDHGARRPRGGARPQPACPAASHRVSELRRRGSSCGRSRTRALRSPSASRARTTSSCTTRSPPRRRVTPVLVTDEQAASFMADGVARSSGGVGVLNLVPGAGMTHALSGIAEAYLDGVPLVVLACGIRTDTGRAYQLHAIDQLAVVRPVAKAVFPVREPRELYATVRRAFALARAGTPGPVVVEVPAELYLLRHDFGATTWEPEPPASTAPAAGRCRARGRPPRGRPPRPRLRGVRRPRRHARAAAARGASRGAGRDHDPGQGRVPRVAPALPVERPGAERAGVRARDRAAAATRCSRSAAASPRSAPRAGGSRRRRRSCTWTSTPTCSAAISPPP